MKNKQTENKSSQYNRIIKECFWDYHVSPDTIEKILTSNDMRAKQKIFSKIIYNASDKVVVLSHMFDQKTLKILFDNFVATYNKEYIDKQVLLLRNILLGEKNCIESLEWKKR